ncbi:MAG: fructose-1,6-bisphosphatase [Ruminococcaceae bacterium]|nr:fructose-1,6-bisphosphatase [Oscillospiraceae bacterium]
MREFVNYPREDIEYLKLLSQKFPTAQSAATEIINLKAIQNLPKGTEHFISDIHGEYEAFTHIMRSASGAIREKIDMLFSKVLDEEERSTLATVIYYPEEKIKDTTMHMYESEKEEWYRNTLNYLLELCHLVSSKYTRSKVRKALPEEYAYVIDELLNTDFNLHNKKEYYHNIITTIIDIGKAPDFIVSVCYVIQHLIVDHLHIVGDIFDRGPRADIVMEDLINYHSVDIQWGNHDIVWMGAAAGSPVCIATVLSNSIRYNNLHVLETGYGISLRPLSVFANEVYANSNVERYIVDIDDMGENNFRITEKDIELTGMMAKAITIIMFKLEGQVIMRNPDFDMDNRLLLEKINFEKGTIKLGFKEYELLDTDFPTLDPKNPYALTEEEQRLMDELCENFRASEKLQKHIVFLFSKGSMYRCYNGNLLFHGSIPMEKNGDFKEFTFGLRSYSGKNLFDFCAAKAHDGYFAGEDSYERQLGQDFMWWLWCGKYSPLFARDKITTFERRLIADKETWIEQKDPYYTVTETARGCEFILREFNLSGKHSHIINGHTPVRASEGENPVKGEGKLINIDGGFCRAYQKTTGIAGYTLIYNSYVMRLSSHEAFTSREEAIRFNKDIVSASVVFERLDKRIKIAETDNGRKLQKQVDNLYRLLNAYKLGIIAEGN